MESTTPTRTTQAKPRKTVDMIARVRARYPDAELAAIAGGFRIVAATFVAYSDGLTKRIEDDGATKQVGIGASAHKAWKSAMDEIVADERWMDNPRMVRVTPVTPAEDASSPTAAEHGTMGWLDSAIEAVHSGDDLALAAFRAWEWTPQWRLPELALQIDGIMGADWNAGMSLLEQIEACIAACVAGSRVHFDQRVFPFTQAGYAEPEVAPGRRPSRRAVGSGRSVNAGGMLAAHGLASVSGGAPEAAPDDPRTLDLLHGPVFLPAKAAAMSFVKLAADSADCLRKCDVYRVLSTARGEMTVARFRGFARWLHSCVEGEVKTEVEDVYLEVAEIAPPSPAGRPKTPLPPPRFFEKKIEGAIETIIPAIGGQHSPSSSPAPDAAGLLAEATIVRELAAGPHDDRKAGDAAVRAWWGVRDEAEVAAIGGYLGRCYRWVRITDNAWIVERPFLQFVRTPRYAQPIPLDELRAKAEAAAAGQIARVAAAPDRAEEDSRAGSRDTTPGAGETSAEPVATASQVENEPNVAEVVEATAEYHRIISRSLGQKVADDATREGWRALGDAPRARLVALMAEQGYRAFPPLTDDEDAWVAFVAACADGEAFPREGDVERHAQAVAAAELMAHDGGEVPALTDAERVALELMGDDAVDELSRLGIMSVSGGAPDLLPCPFCGKPPVSEWVPADDAGTQDCGYWFIGCVHCTVATTAEDSEQESAAKWNTRVEPHRPVPYDEVVGALREIVDEVEPGHNGKQFEGLIAFASDLLARIDSH